MPGEVPLCDRVALPAELDYGARGVAAFARFSLRPDAVLESDEDATVQLCDVVGLCELFATVPSRVFELGAVEDGIVGQ
jgi:hypothetical protein